MLPDVKEMSGFEAYAVLPEPRTVRLGFCKVDELQYISHLDLQRTFTRILARADLPLWYTQGFNPHPKMVFALPLPIGCSSVCEMVDIRIDRDMPCDEILRRMRGATTSHLDFTSCYIPENKFAGIAFAEYRIVIGGSFGAPAKAAESVRTVLTTGPLRVMKHSKSGEREVDIVPLIHSADVQGEQEALTVTAVLSAGTGDNLSPEYLITALRQKLNILRGGEEYSILRLRVLDADGHTFE